MFNQEPTQLRQLDGSPPLRATEGVKVWLTVSDDPSHMPIVGRWADVSDDGLVDGETPIEDYPFWLISDTEISEDEAWNRWIKVLTEREVEYVATIGGAE